MDRFWWKRLGVAVIISALIGSGVLAAVSFAGNDAGSIMQFWPSGILLLGLVFLCVEFSGKLRDPKETYDRQLEDDWDR